MPSGTTRAPNERGLRSLGPAIKPIATGKIICKVLLTISRSNAIFFRHDPDLKKATPFVPKHHCAFV